LRLRWTLSARRQDLKEMGYSNVRNLGGFKGWLEAGGDVEKA
jgi:rhodanese-related sulfurtransferase